MAAVKKQNQFVNIFLAFWLIFSVADTILPSSSRAEPKDILSLLKEKGILSEEDILTIRESEKERLKGKFKNGFQWETGDGLAAIQIGGRVNADIDIFENAHAKNDSIYLKRARIFTSGRISGHYEWKVEGEFAEGTVAARDLFININHDERMQVKIGQYKEPFALEQNSSVNYIDFKERSIIGSRIAPDRDIGLVLHGLLSNDTLGYQLGVFNGNGLNNASDSDNYKDAAMRYGMNPSRTFI
ncbi:MAG: hypothetical protein HZA01_00200 [Nitrospinae bacterium]|nr:hypothetical protein [Nitrospinota bacterium]